jgi:metal-dependent hydrolase (beta-lactamase superfamily II)
MATFLAPLIKGIEVLAGAPSYATLIEHPSGRKVLFDLGIRKDTENLAPGVLGIAKQFGWTMQNGKNVSEVLSENGISPKEIESVIWSHHHFDQ